MSTIQILSIVGSLAVLGMVTMLIRRQRLREEYAILWFVSSLLLILLSIRREFLHQAAELFGIAYPPSLLLLAGLVVGFLLAMHLSISLTRLSEENKILAQELSLLRYELSRQTLHQREADDEDPSTRRG